MTLRLSSSHPSSPRMTCRTVVFGRRAVSNADLCVAIEGDGVIDHRRAAECSPCAARRGCLHCRNRRLDCPPGCPARRGYSGIKVDYIVDAVVDMRLVPRFDCQRDLVVERMDEFIIKKAVNPWSRT
jgi:hypothetical protein